MSIRNASTPEGRVIGERIAQWCDDAEPKARLVAPSIPHRCASCAFRKGNHLANGSPNTVMDALKCVMEKTPFYCHDVHRPDHLCSGWLMMVAADDKPARDAPWPFTGGEE